MKKAISILILLLPLYGIGFGQSLDHKPFPKLYQIPLEISFSNNGTFVPGGGALGVWSRTFHPGVSLGTRFYYKSKPQKSQLFQTAKLGYFYHRHAQHGIQLYSELGYRKYIGKSFYVEPRLGLGYLLSIPDLQIFTFKNGVYEEKKSKARSQFMGGLTVAAGYDFQHLNKRLPMDAFLGYQFWVQSPFVNKYVPILPNNSVHIGFIYYFTHYTK